MERISSRAESRPVISQSMAVKVMLRNGCRHSTESSIRWCSARTSSSGPFGLPLRNRSRFANLESPPMRAPCQTRRPPFFALANAILGESDRPHEPATRDLLHALDEPEGVLEELALQRGDLLDADEVVQLGAFVQRGELLREPELHEEAIGVLEVEALPRLEDAPARQLPQPLEGVGGLHAVPERVQPRQVADAGDGQLDVEHVLALAPRRDGHAAEESDGQPLPHHLLRDQAKEEAGPRLEQLPDPR